MAQDEEVNVEAYGLITRTWTLHDKYGYGCAECCTGDRCDEDCDAKYKGRRKDCPHCKGTGWIPVEETTAVMTVNWYNKTEMEFKQRFIEDSNEIMDNFDKNMDEHTHAVIAGASITTGDGIFPMIEKANDFPRLPENPTLEDIRNHLDITE